VHDHPDRAARGADSSAPRAVDFGFTIGAKNSQVQVVASHPKTDYRRLGVHASNPN
jgi:hypothetical protein